MHPGIASQKNKQVFKTPRRVAQISADAYRHPVGKIRRTKPSGETGGLDQRQPIGKTAAELHLYA